VYAQPFVKHASHVYVCMYVCACGEFFEYVFVLLHVCMVNERVCVCVCVYSSVCIVCYISLWYHMVWYVSICMYVCMCVWATVTIRVVAARMDVFMHA
jgi:hypothetical protein